MIGFLNNGSDTMLEVDFKFNSTSQNQLVSIHKKLEYI